MANSDDAIVQDEPVDVIDGVIWQIDVDVRRCQQIRITW